MQLTQLPAATSTTVGLGLPKGSYCTRLHEKPIKEASNTSRAVRLLEITTLVFSDYSASAAEWALIMISQ